MLNILFIGDINGKIGRKTVVKVLPKLKKKLKPGLVIANAENAAHGSGMTVDTIKEMQKGGVEWFTAGDHAFDRNNKAAEIYESDLPVIRPANFPPQVPGQGYALIKSGKYNVLLINLIGRVFMRRDYDCPFRKLDEILANNNLHDKNISAIIVDIHAEATSEKIAFKHYADGRVSALLGTHTHVMTADQTVTEKGTAYTTDTGMVGAADGVIGLDKENIVKSYLTQIKHKSVIPEKGRAVFNAVFVNINPKTGRAIAIKPIQKFVVIK